MLVIEVYVLVQYYFYLNVLFGFVYFNFLLIYLINRLL